VEARLNRGLIVATTRLHRGHDQAESRPRRGYYQAMKEASKKLISRPGFRSDLFFPATSRREKNNNDKDNAKKKSSLSLFVDEDFESDSAISVGHFVLHDVARVDGLAHDLQQDARGRLLHLDEDQRREIALLADVGIEGYRHVAVLRVIFQRTQVVLVGGVLALALQAQIRAVDFRNKLEDLVELDGEAGRAVFETEVGVDAVVHDVTMILQQEFAGLRAPFRLVSGLVDVFAVEVVLVRLSFDVGVGQIFWVKEFVHVVDVRLVGRGFGLGELDHSLVLVGTRAESHAWILRENGVGSSEQRRFIVGEGIEENGQKAREENGQTRVVDQVEEADPGPGRRSTGEDGTRLFVVDGVTHAHLGSIDGPREREKRRRKSLRDKIRRLMQWKFKQIETTQL